MFYKICVLNNFWKFIEKHQCLSHFLNKVAGGVYHIIKKESPAQVFSSEFCEIFKNSVLKEHPHLFVDSLSNISSSRIFHGKA